MEKIQAAKDDKRWHPVVKQMLRAWNEGMASLRSVKMEDQYKGLSKDIRAAGFSNPLPPERPPAIGRSELLRVAP